MRPRCKCGNIAGYWYAPIIYVRMRADQFLHAHCYCESCADTENWAEYEYIGFHKKDWRWLKMTWVHYLIEKSVWMDAPYYTVSHLKEGKRWYLCIARSIEEAEAYKLTYEGVEWEEKYYRDIRSLP